VKTILLFGSALFLYALLYWFSCIRNQRRLDTGWFLGGSLLCVIFLGTNMLLSMFWVLFSAVGILVVFTYIGSTPKYKHGKALRNGVIGGIWLIIPVYAYVASNP
jgi:4-hydroxybenzoate polyprenyltransferase